jgi:hypothetical protein
MDFGAPLKDLGPVDIAPLQKLVEDLDEAAWTRNTFRQEILSNDVHSISQNILFKTEWHTSAHGSKLTYFEDLVWLWCKEKGYDPQHYLPIAKEETDIWPVYTFPDWLDYKDVLEPIVRQVIKPLKTETGVVTRLALVRLPAGGHIPPHIDGQVMATKAHRIHVPVSNSPSVEYKIDGRKVTMVPGHAYDFNNRVRHSVRNKGRRPRVNLFVDYYPDPGFIVTNPLAAALKPVYAPPTPLQRLI